MFHKIHLQTSPKRSKFIAEPSHLQADVIAPTPFTEGSFAQSTQAYTCNMKLVEPTRKRQLSLNVKSNLGTKNRLLEGNSWYIVIPEMLLVLTAYQWQSKPLKHTQFRMVVVFFPVTHMASRNIERLWVRWQVLFLHSPPSLYSSRWPGALEDKASHRCSRRNRQITRNLHENWTKKQPFMVDMHKPKWVTQYACENPLLFLLQYVNVCEIIQGCTTRREARRTGRGRGVSQWWQLQTATVVTCTRLNSKDVQNWVLACFSSAKETSVFLFRCFWILQLMSKVWCKSESLCMLRCLNLLGGILLWIPNLPASGAWKSWICEHHTTSPPYHLQHLSTMGQLDNNSHLICLHGSPTLLEGRSATWTCSRPTCLICL